MSGRLARLVVAAIAAGLSLGCRWVAFHPREFTLKFFPYYDQYYQPSRVGLEFMKFFGLFGHILFTVGALSILISAFLPLRFTGSALAFLPAVVISVFVWKKSLLGLRDSQEKDKLA